ncbi:DNA polymerase III subunit delta [Methylocystis iwaonis]|uniref:DNA polymerase III subunit delta n=1 Tax=Methylocystis iwaonis TaxID=2885079 RepID=UPI002E7BC645|nr:DNA polymerase III subunit delta [Methylocystis iwaonis]
MVAVSGREAERFVASPPENIFLFLVHGADAGMVRERALSIVGKRVDDRHDPFQFVELSGDTVASDPLTLLDEANTTPLFGGRRAILVETGAKSVIPAVTSLVSAPPAACTVVLTASALKKDAPLRKLVEGAKQGAGIECLPDTEQDIHALVDRTLREANLVATPEARALLLAALGEDRLMSRAELAKLVLYMHGREHVEAADVEAIVAHASSIASDRVVAAAFAGDAGETLDAYFAQGGDAGAVLFGALRYAVALHRARLTIERESGRTDAGVTALFRAGFGFMHRALMEEQLKAWTSPRLAALIEPLREAQTRARANAASAQMEAERALWRVAKAARRR